MLIYVIKRIFIMVPTLLAISALVFFIIHLPPGDFLSAQIDELMAQGGPNAMKKVEELRHQYGLDLPLLVRYFNWLGGMLHGDFGFSFDFGLGTRSQRYAAILQDGVVTDLFLEKGGGLDVSSADSVLAAL